MRFEDFRIIFDASIIRTKAIGILASEFFNCLAFSRSQAGYPSLGLPD